MSDARHPEDDTFKFHCICGRKLKARLEMVGKVSVCPACGKKLTVPAPSAQPTQVDTSSLNKRADLPHKRPALSTPQPDKQGFSPQLKLTMLVCGGILAAVITAIIIMVMAQRPVVQENPTKTAQTGPDQPTEENQLASPPPAPEPPQPSQPTVENVVENCRKSVVVVDAKYGTGSGFLVDADGLVVTNYHVIRTGLEKDLKVHQASWSGDVRHLTTYDTVNIVALDETADIALLRVQDLKVKPLDLADCLSLKIGQKVVTIGNPAPGGQILCNSVSEGIVSNLESQIDGITHIQTTAPVNPGNSGGPLLNLKGEVVGIVTLKTTNTEGIAFAVPVNKLQALLKEFRKNPTATTARAKDVIIRDGMEFVLELMVVSEGCAKDLVDYYGQEWHSAIYSGRNFNLALQKAVLAMDKPRELLRATRKIIEERISNLKSHPKDVEKCYDYLLTAYSAYCELADMAESPEGSYQTFTKKKEELHSSFKQAVTKARVLVK